MMELSPNRQIRLAEIFKLMGDPTRLRILMRCLQNPATVGMLCEELEIAQPLVSHHIKLLKTGRLLGAMREGRHIWYQPLDQHVRTVLEVMILHLEEEA